MWTVRCFRHHAALKDPTVVLLSVILSFVTGVAYVLLYIYQTVSSPSESNGRSWANLRGSPSFWVAMVFWLATLLFALIPLQYMFLIEGRRMVDECLLRLRALTCLLAPTRLRLACGTTALLDEEEAYRVLRTPHRRVALSSEVACSPDEWRTLYWQWHRAWDVVVEVDCHFLLTSVSALFGLYLATAVLLLALLMILAFLDRRFFELSRASDGALLGLFLAGLAFVGIIDSVVMVARISCVYQEFEQQQHQLQTLHLAAVSGNEFVSDTGSIRSGAGATDPAMARLVGYLRELSTALKREQRPPRVLGLPVRPTMVSVLQGYAVTAALAAGGKIVSVLL